MQLRIVGGSTHHGKASRTLRVSDMCEFCNLPGNNHIHGNDRQDLRFAGFFSADAICLVVEQSKKQRRDKKKGRGGDDDLQVEGEEDDDGT